MNKSKKLPFYPTIRPHICLWLAISIFGASTAVTRKLTEIGAHHFIGTRNPISLCNVLFVGNLCALFVLIIIYWKQLNRANLTILSKKEWYNAILVAVLAGAIAPGLVFQALNFTAVNNIVLVGRLQPPLVLGLSAWLLRERVSFWDIVGAIVCFIGVALIIFLQPPQGNEVSMVVFKIGIGEMLAAASAITSAISTIIAKKYLSSVPLGIFSIVRTVVGTAIFFTIAQALYGSDHFADVLSPFLWKWMLLYGVLIVVVGQSCWSESLRYLPVSTVSLATSFSPIAGILAAYFILGEAPTSAQYLGGSIIFIGLLVGWVGVNRLGTRRNNRFSYIRKHASKEIENETEFRGI